MSFASDFITYLESKGFGSIANPNTLSGSLWVNTMPNDPNNCIAAYEFKGRPTEKTHGGVWGEVSNVQIQVRHVDLKSSEALCEKVFRYLDNKKLVINGTVYLYILGRMSPAKLKVDENNRTVFYCEFEAMRRPPWMAQEHFDSLNSWSDAVQVSLT